MPAVRRDLLLSVSLLLLYGAPRCRPMGEDLMGSAADAAVARQDMRVVLDAAQKMALVRGRTQFLVYHLSVADTPPLLPPAVLVS